MGEINFIEGQNTLAAMLCFKFHVIEGHRHVIRLGVTEGPNVRDQIVFCAFYSILMEVQINAGYIHATHA